MFANRISISYSQLCVFDPSLTEPYNEWLPAHQAQGFSWRPRSVSFATTIDRGDCEVVAEIASTDPIVDAAVRAVAVPFEAPPEGSIEIGSIMSGALIKLAPGSYRLVFADYGARVHLTFIPGEGNPPEVLKEDREVRKQAEYLMRASPG